MAKLRYHLSPAEFCLFSLELEQNAHTKWCSSFFFFFFLWPLWINFKSYGVFLSQWALLHLTALCFYILNYDIKVIKICQKRGENINKGPCSEFSPSQLPVAFIQLSDPQCCWRGSPATFVHLFIQPCVDVRKSLPAFHHWVLWSEICLLLFHLFNSSYITAQWLCIEPGDINM